jgi:hypothetical protein
MPYRTRLATAISFSLFGLFAGCGRVPSTVENDLSLEFVELGNYRFHVRTFGDKQLPPVIVVHGGPGGDSKYLYPLQDLSRNHHLIFYDQRGTGLSPRARITDASLTLPTQAASSAAPNRMTIMAPLNCTRRTRQGGALSSRPAT